MVRSVLSSVRTDEINGTLQISNTQNQILPINQAVFQHVNINMANILQQIDQRREKNLNVINNTVVLLLIVYLLLVGTVSNYIWILVLHTIWNFFRDKFFCLSTAVLLVIYNSVLPLTLKYSIYTVTYIDISLDTCVAFGCLSTSILIIIGSFRLQKMLTYNP
jgi:hypothetical protein